MLKSPSYQKRIKGFEVAGHLNKKRKNKTLDSRGKLKKFYIIRGKSEGWIEKQVGRDLRSRPQGANRKNS